jgi:hypothetical protein
VAGLEALFAGIAAVWAVILGVVLLSFAIPYAVLRIRDIRSERPDPQIGMKAAMYFFFSIGIMLFLTGLTVLVVDLIVSPDRRGQTGLTENQRTSLALMVSGVLFAIIHLVLVKAATNDRNPAARRIFAGWRMAIHGMTVISLVTALLVIYFQKDFGGEGTLRTRKTLWGMILIWVPSWVLHLVLVWFYSRPLYEPSRSPERPDWER